MEKRKDLVSYKAFSFFNFDWPKFEYF